MRNGQNKRMRGRNRNKGQSPLTRVYESNGPDVKIRGTASHVAEKYLQLARDAQSSGDPVSAENYYQHAEHYFRMIAAAQEQFRQNQPSFYRPDGQPQQGNFDNSDDDDDGAEAQMGGGEPGYGPREPQPQPHMQQGHAYPMREPQPSFNQRDQQPHHYRQQHGQPAGHESGNVDRLPSFITGGGQPQQQPQQPPYQGHGQNGHENQSDRFPLHRRRRRHRGPRNDMGNNPQ